MKTKKLIVICLIFLFIGISVAPSITQSVVKASQDDDLVEITTQACGITGYRDTTVKLTREQANDLDQVFETLDSKMKKATSREESVRFYHDTLIELDRYGVLPQGMTIDQAQYLVMGWTQNHFERVLDMRQQKIFPTVNVFCLIFGSVEGQPPYPPNPFPFLVDIGPSYLFVIPFAILLSKLGAENLAIGLMRFFILVNPLKFLNIIWINALSVDLHSVGLKGIGTSEYSPSVVLGYTGLLLRPSIDKAFLFGSALAVI